MFPDGIDLEPIKIILNSKYNQKISSNNLHLKCNLDRIYTMYNIKLTTLCFTDFIKNINSSNNKLQMYDGTTTTEITIPEGNYSLSDTAQDSLLVYLTDNYGSIFSTITLTNNRLLFTFLTTHEFQAIDNSVYSLLGIGTLQLGVAGSELATSLTTEHYPNMIKDKIFYVELKGYHESNTYINRQIYSQTQPITNNSNILTTLPHTSNFGELFIYNNPVRSTKGTIFDSSLEAFEVVILDSDFNEIFDTSANNEVIFEFDLLVEKI